MDENKAPDPRLAETVKGVWDSLTAEQKEKAKDCKTWDELAAFAGREGIELPDELLDAVAGGYLHKSAWDFKTRTSYYEVINDNTGEVMGKDVNWSTARDMAMEKGQSTNIVGDWQLEQIRKKANGC